MWEIPDNKRWRLKNTMDNESTCKHDNGELMAVDVEHSGWGFFSDELSLFLVDFFKRRLNPTQKLIFYSYYVTGMTLEEISERMYGTAQVKKFQDEEESDRDDAIIENIDSFHCSHQAINKKLIEINRMLKHAWQYSDRWRDSYDRG